MIFLGLKTDSHLKWIFYSKGETYPGLFVALLRSSMVEKFIALFPYPVRGEKIPVTLQKQILMYSILALLSLLLTIFSPAFYN